MAEYISDYFVKSENSYAIHYFHILCLIDISDETNPVVESMFKNKGYENRQILLEEIQQVLQTLNGAKYLTTFVRPWRSNMKKAQHNVVGTKSDFIESLPGDMLSLISSFQIHIFHRRKYYRTLAYNLLQS